MVFVKLICYLAVLILVLALAYYTTRVVGSGISMKQKEAGIQILDRISVARDSYLAVVKIQDRIWLLGISPAGIEKLEELDEYERPGMAKPLPDFAALLASKLKKNGRDGS